MERRYLPKKFVVIFVVTKKRQVDFLHKLKIVICPVQCPPSHHKSNNGFRQSDDFLKPLFFCSYKLLSLFSPFFGEITPLSTCLTIWAGAPEEASAPRFMHWPQALRNPMKFIWTGGEKSDYTQAVPLLSDETASAVLASKGYDAWGKQLQGSLEKLGPGIFLKEGWSKGGKICGMHAIPGLLRPLRNLEMVKQTAVWRFKTYGSVKTPQSLSRIEGTVVMAFRAFQYFQG